MSLEFSCLQYNLRVYEKLLHCYIYIIFRVPTGFGKKESRVWTNICMSRLLPLSSLFVCLYICDPLSENPAKVILL